MKESDSAVPKTKTIILLSLGQLRQGRYRFRVVRVQKILAILAP